MAAVAKAAGGVCLPIPYCPAAKDDVYTPKPATLSVPAIGAVAIMRNKRG